MSILSSIELKGNAMKDQSQSTIFAGKAALAADKSKFDDDASESHSDSFCLKRNILGKLEKPHEAKIMATFSHNHYEIKDNIIIGYDFTELKETSGAQLFRVRT